MKENRYQYCLNDFFPIEDTKPESGTYLDGKTTWFDSQHRINHDSVISFTHTISTEIKFQVVTDRCDSIATVIESDPSSDFENQIQALVSAPLEVKSLAENKGKFPENQQNLAILPLKIAAFHHSKLQENLQEVLALIAILPKREMLKAMKTVAFILLGTVVGTWLFHQEASEFSQQPSQEKVLEKPENPQSTSILPINTEKSPSNQESVPLLPPKPINDPLEISNLSQPEAKPVVSNHQPNPTTTISQTPKTNSVVVDRYYIPQNPGSNQVANNAPVVVDRYYLPATMGTSETNNNHKPTQKEANLPTLTLAQTPITPLATPASAKIPPNPIIVDRYYLPQTATDNAPVNSESNQTPLEQPIQKAALASTPAQAPENLETSSVSNEQPANTQTYLLTGVMSFEAQPVALFQVGEQTVRVYPGEQVNFSDWILKDIVDEKAILQKGDSTISLKVGESLADNFSQ